MEFCYCKEDNVECFEMTVYTCGHVFFKCCAYKLVNAGYNDCPECKEPESVCTPVNLFPKFFCKIDTTHE